MLWLAAGQPTAGTLRGRSGGELGRWYTCCVIQRGCSWQWHSSHSASALGWARMFETRLQAAVDRVQPRAFTSTFVSLAPPLQDACRRVCGGHVSPHCRFGRDWGAAQRRVPRARRQRRWVAMVACSAVPAASTRRHVSLSGCAACWMQRTCAGAWGWDGEVVCQAALLS